MLLNELYDQPLPYDLQQQDGEYEGSFEVEGIEYGVEIMKVMPRSDIGLQFILRQLPKEIQSNVSWSGEGEMDDDAQDQLQEIIDEYGDELIEKYPSFWVHFHAETDRGSEDKITGTGNAIKVFSTVVEMVMQVVKANPNTLEIMFESVTSEPSRMKLYDRLVKIFAKKTGFVNRSTPGAYVLVNGNLK
jgi:hypothetical protein